jgi:hypothetical protein
LWWARFWLASSFVTTSDGMVTINSVESSLASFKFFNSSSTFASVTGNVLMEFVFAHNESTDVPRFLANSGVIDFVDNSGQWNDLSVLFTTDFWWFARFQNLTTTAGIDFVSWSLTWWARLNFAIGFWFTFANVFEAWTLVVIFQVMSQSLFFNLSRANITGDWFFSWTGNVVTTVLASSSVATAVKAVFVAKSHSGAILKILTNGWNMFDGWSFTINKNTSVFITSVFTGPLVTNWIFESVVFTKFFSTSVITDTRRVSFTLVFSVFSWSTSQVVAAWSANWWLFNTLVTEVAHDDFTFASTFSGHAFDVIVEDHFTSFHQSTSVVASSGFRAFLEAWEFEALSRVGSATFASSSSDLISLSWWAYWWVIDA